MTESCGPEGSDSSHGMTQETCRSSIAHGDDDVVLPTSADEINKSGDVPLRFGRSCTSVMSVEPNLMSLRGQSRASWSSALQFGLASDTKSNHPKVGRWTRFRVDQTRPTDLPNKL